MKQVNVIVGQMDMFLSVEGSGRDLSFLSHALFFKSLLGNLRLSSIVSKSFHRPMTSKIKVLYPWEVKYVHSSQLNSGKGTPCLSLASLLRQKPPLRIELLPL